MQRNLTTPIPAGSIDMIAPGTLSVHCIFNEDTGLFEVSALSLDVREGEITGSGPYEFIGHGGGNVERPVANIPAVIITEIESLLNRGLVLYAAQEGYDI